MKTTNQNPKIERKTHQIDATNKAVGRIASQIALLLQGKNKPSFTRRLDMGDFVIVSNINKLGFSGKKMEQKLYYRHSHYPGGIKKIPLKKVFAEKPKKMNEYLPDSQLQEIIIAPLKLTNLLNKTDLTVLVRGGGKRGQADAIRHGIARALNKYDLSLHKTLKVAGFLTRDARIKERKKPGLKRARKAPQWAKR
ncbi:MAG: 30S ribosomal protein S9 [Candidatus Parcubacteria bacterium]|nr:30S ribosomal protein S9 [Candidatus Parcubacteria bacterium]